jgi:hypothetical protein
LKHHARAGKLRRSLTRRWIPGYILSAGPYLGEEVFAAILVENKVRGWGSRICVVHQNVDNSVCLPSTFVIRITL